jgi:XTP/dITP diphosphohydrolase
MRVVLATANPHKATEMAGILGPQFELVARPTEVPDVDETGDTLLDNARLKAAALVAATGLAALADDTGLEVESLEGRPGVRSARYAGEGATDADNRARLLAELGERADRAARFRTVVVLRFADGHEIVGEGEIVGSITAAPRGANGFGYDSVFQPAGSDLTFAEMTSEAKNSMSHRRQALVALSRHLGVVPQ